MLDVLVVDDDQVVRSSVADAIADRGHRVAEASDGDEALRLARTRAFDLAVCDVHMPHMGGLTLFRRLRREAPDTAVVMMTAFGNVSDVVEAFQGGGADYVTKPFDPEDFAVRVVGAIARRRAFSHAVERTHASLAPPRSAEQFVATSHVMRQLLHRASIVAKTDASVFITGERGTGKKSIARQIHAESPRHEGPFVVLRCADLQSGPYRTLTLDRRAHLADESFRAAEGGTLVLDGVDKLSMQQQAPLLRLVDDPGSQARRDRHWNPVGVRLVSLSETLPAGLVGGGALMTSMLYRLSTVHIPVPSLDCRDGDLLPLVCELLRRLTATTPSSPPVTLRALEALASYGFPGNVRELSSILEHAATRSSGNTIDLQHLPIAVAGQRLPPSR